MQYLGISKTFLPLLFICLSIYYITLLFIDNPFLKPSLSLLLKHFIGKAECVQSCMVLQCKTLVKVTVNL